MSGGEEVVVEYFSVGRLATLEFVVVHGSIHRVLRYGVVRRVFLGRRRHSYEEQQEERQCSYHTTASW